MRTVALPSKLLWAAALSIALAGSAEAATFTYTLDQVSANGSGALGADGVPYVSVTVSDDVANNEIDFSFALLGNVDAYKGTGQAGIKSVGFNVASAAVSSSGPVGGFGITNIASGFTLPADHTMNGFGTFEVKLDGTGSATRYDPLTFSLSTTNALWSGRTAVDFFALSGGSATQGNVAFSVGVTGITTAGFSGGNPFFGGGAAAPVPLPAAAWLLLSGLGAVGAIRRRRIGAA
jgi:hypothetical protein